MSSQASAVGGYWKHLSVIFAGKTPGTRYQGHMVTHRLKCSLVLLSPALFRLFYLPRLRFCRSSFLVMQMYCHYHSCQMCQVLYMSVHQLGRIHGIYFLERSAKICAIKVGFRHLYAGLMPYNVLK